MTVSLYCIFSYSWNNHFHVNIQAVVFTDISLEKAVEFDSYCHNHQPPIAFIKSEIRGLFGSVFCDFGPEFTVLDVDGEEPHTGIVASISNDNPALVSCVDDERLEFQDGDLVVFSEVHGMSELNDGKPRKIKNARPYSFTLEEDTTSYGTYVRGGIVTQVKPPKVLKFKTLKDAIKEPGEFLMSDFSKIDRPPLLHLAFQALDKFRNDLRRFPIAGSSDDVQRLIDFAISINESLGDSKLEELDKKLLHHFASGSRAVLNPMAAMFGGIVGQEVVKACSGKFHPLYQFFYFDSVESLPVEPLEPAELKPENTRYDAQISVFGSNLQKKLEQAKIFMQLTYTFPEDAMTSSGAPFWSAPKRFPRPLEFSTSDPSQLNFILAAAILRAETFGIPIPDWVKNPAKMAEAVDKVIVPDFQPKQGVKIVTDEKATSLSSASVDDAAVIEELIAKLEAISKTLQPGFQMKPIQFEKDDDTNYHMDVIAGFANMRARNYSIPEVDKLKAKFIAGRIIPAIATSTAMATGLVCLELYKVLGGGHKVEDYRNTFANLAIPLFSMAEPVPPKTIKHQDMAWTVWDRWTITGNITLRELLDWLKEKGLNAYSISCGTSLLYNSMFPRHKERLDKKVVDVAREVAKVEVPPYRRHLDVVVACEDDDDNDVDIPLVSIYFR
uniref:Ubiquitin-activating enzyme E1 C-terminal domain-containing protein n=1 Tax=Oryza rufipogon TaxID=4529 RepID=A0A0E0RCN2_ORYRU